MSSEATTNSDTRSPSAAERMRLHRKRRHNGLRHVGIMLHVTEVEALVRKGYLSADKRNDIWALQAAVHELLYEVLDNSA